MSLSRVGDWLPDRCSKCNESKYSPTILNPYVLTHHVTESATQNSIPPCYFEREVHVLLGRKFVEILKLNFGHVIFMWTSMFLYLTNIEFTISKFTRPSAFAKLSSFQAESLNWYLRKMYKSKRKVWRGQIDFLWAAADWTSSEKERMHVEQMDEGNNMDKLCPQNIFKPH